MANTMFSIPRFSGAKYGIADNLVSLGYASEAVNVDTSDGALQTLVGAVPYPRVFPSSLGIDTVDLVRMWQNYKTDEMLFISGGKIYKISLQNVESESAMAASLAYTPSASSQAKLELTDKVFETSISGEDVVIALPAWSNTAARPQVIRYLNANYSIRDFGTGQFLTSDVITQITSDSTGITSLTIGRRMTATEKARCIQAGVYIMETENQELDFTAAYVSDVELGTGTSQIVLLDPLSAGSVQTGNYVKVRGGLSDRPVHFMCMYYGRLFAAGDADHPNRLYWSCLPGDGRTIEDWSADDASSDTGGGYVEVGPYGTIRGLFLTQSQLLIWKDDELWRLYGATPSQYTLEQVQSGIDVRLPGQDRVVDVRGVLYFLLDDGLYYYDGSRLQRASGDQTLREYLQLLPGARARNYERELNSSRAGAKQVVFWQDDLYVYFRDYTAGFVFKYDLSSGSVEKYDFCGPLRVTTRGVLLHGTNSNARACLLLDDFNMVAGAAVLDPGSLSNDGWEGAFHKIPGGSEDSAINAAWESQDLSFGEVSYNKRLRRVGIDVTGPIRVIVKTPEAILHDKAYETSDFRSRRFLWISVDMPYESTFRIRFESIDGKPFRIHNGADFYIEMNQRN